MAWPGVGAWQGRTVRLLAVGALLVAATASGSTTPPSDRGPGDFGDRRAVCGPGNATGATDQGVTAEQIVVGTGADPGNTIVPGLDQELIDTAVAFVGWCNDAGGILGRRLVLHTYDAALFEVGAVMLRACQTDFLLVGNGFGLDDAGVDLREGCGLPQIAAFTASERSGASATSLEPAANPATGSAMAGIFRRIAAEDAAAISHFGVLNHELPSTRVIGERDRTAAEQAGFHTVYTAEFPVVSMDNWRPYVEGIKHAGVAVLHFMGTPGLLAPLLRTMNDVGYFPRYITLQGNMYDPAVVAEAGELLDRTTVLIDESLVPFESATPGSATQQYVEILGRYVPGAPPRALGVTAWSAWSLFATAAAACGSQLTRSCVMRQAKAVGQWTGGGLHAPAVPSNTLDANGDCFVAVQATSHGFAASTRFTDPNTGVFHCRGGG